MVDDVCDESKCISLPLEDNEKQDLSYCYGGGSRQLPMMCTDGFLPVVVDDEPLVDGYQYFTCCPPSTHQESKDVTRHCSEPIFGIDDDAADAAAACESRDDDRRYPRTLAPIELSSESVRAVICCDNNAINTMNFLDEVECVPYNDDFYSYAMASENSVGKISGMECDVGGDFVYPRPIDNDSPIDLGSGRFQAYQCCKNGPAVHYRVDSAFKITLYPTFVLYCISAVVSLVIAAALLVPLVNKPRESNFHQRLSQIGGRSSFTVTTAASAERKTNYSSYNLYLAALVVADLVYALIQIGIFGSAINQRFDLRYHAGFASELGVRGMHVLGIYVIINLWINAVVAYQVLNLLRNSQQCQRIGQLSRSKAIRQIGVVYGVSMALGVGNYFLYEASYVAPTTAKKNAFLYPAMALYILMSFSPLVYVAYVAILIKRRKYMQVMEGSSATSKASRALWIYFGRILAVFYGIWLPGIVMLLITEVWGKMLNVSYLKTVTFCLYATQPLITSCVILSKPEIRKYVWNLFTLAFLDTNGKNGKSSRGGISSMNQSSKSGGFSTSVPFGNATIGLSGADSEVNTTSNAKDGVPIVTFDPSGAISASPAPYEQKGNTSSDGSDDDVKNRMTSSDSSSQSE